MMDDVREIVRQKYAEAITKKRSCCGDIQGGCCGSLSSETTRAITGDLYSVDDILGLPEDIITASFGCGNPTLLAQLNPGEVVLDLGSGAGLDVLLSAKRVGPTGKAYGLDMTDEMLAEARANQAKSGIKNVEFLKGHIEDIPLPDNSVDVIISNCVINLSTDKDQVFKEALRVLKPGGRMAVADIVLTKPLPPKVQQDLMAWAGCVAGALLIGDYKSKLMMAGFSEVDLQIITTYDTTSDLVKSLFPNLSESDLAEANGAVASTFIRAIKPAKSTESEEVNLMGDEIITVTNDCSCKPGCCGSTSQNIELEKRRIVIDFMYLDLNICERCQGTDFSLDEAISDVAKVLESAGIEVIVNKIHVTSEQQAINLQFATSPTIRINGRDIQLEVRETLCESCGDLCGDEVDCRVWVYQGKEYAVPPKAMIIDAILREVYGGTLSVVTQEKEFVLPDNLKKFFASMQNKK